MKILIVFIGLLISFTFVFTSVFAQSTNLPNNFGTIAYEFNGRYYVKDSQNIILSDDVPDNVIKTALARGGDIYIASGTYTLTNNFSGFDLKYGTYLKLASDAAIVVPSGYSGYVFRLGNYVGHGVMDGGHIYEASPVKRHWTAIMMQGGPGGVYFNYIENTVITDPQIVIDFNATTGQWANANTFINIKGWNFVKGIEFDFNGKHTDGIDGFYGNTFRDSQFQAGPMTTYGVKDIKYSFNAFYNVQFWDLPANSISSTIDPSAQNTIIIGGQMTYQGFLDNGKNTIVLDAWHNNVSTNSTITSSIINGTYQSQPITPTLPLHQVMNMSIIQQAPNDFVRGNHGQLIIVPGQSTVVNIYGTVDNPTGGSIQMNLSRPDGVVEQIQADVTSAGAFYYPLMFDKNSLSGQYRVDGLYQNSNLGSLFLNVTTNQETLTNQNVQQNITTTSPPSESNATLSTRIKNDAKLWAQGEISNDDFLNNIQYLAKIGVIESPSQNQSYSHVTSIPMWFKNNAIWWANGQITDHDFFSGVQYLLKSGIMASQ